MSAPNEATDSAGPAVTVEHAPARASSVVAVVAGLVATLSTATGSILSLAVAFLGLGGVAIGLFAVESERLALVGTAILFVGLLVSGVFDNPAPILLFGAIAAFVAFDASQNAFSVGAQLSTETTTTRGELVHVAATLAVGSIAVIVAYGVYLLSAAGQPASALVFLLLCGVLFAWAIRS